LRIFLYNPYNWLKKAFHHKLKINSNPVYIKPELCREIVNTILFVNCTEVAINHFDSNEIATPEVKATLHVRLAVFPQILASLPGLLA
jgi:hypothetical protein